MSVPPRWLHCPRKSKHLIGGNFIAFKTPLSKDFDKHIAKEFRFTPTMLLQSLQSQKITVGLWIDLSNTERYYNKEIIEKSGISYVKLSCKGYGKVPSDEQVKTFIKICSHFLSKHPKDCISVHCTHGFNRTGYLIVSFLVEKMDWSVSAAVKHFQQQRPPGIYKQDYLKAIFEKYGEIEDIPSAPDLPEWYFEDDDNEGKSSHFENRQEKSIIYKEFQKGINNVIPVTDKSLVKKIQQQLKQLCGYGKSDFPGSQPVSLSWDNISLLQRERYMVTWKADGTRYMMFIDGPDQVYLIDRDYYVFQVKEIRFPTPENIKLHLTNTLLDGEMVLDQIHKEGQYIPRYLVYDIVHVQHEAIGRQTLEQRLKCIQQYIINPRIAALKQGLILREKEPFGIRLKGFSMLEQTSQLLSSKFKEQLTHEVDGVIFQPCQEPYKPGRCFSILKWKPQHLITIDFHLRIDKQQGEGLIPGKVAHLYVGGKTTPFATIYKCKALQQYHNSIVECKWNYEIQNWEILRKRCDKSFPNSFATADSVLKSIQNPISEEELLNILVKK